MCEYLQTRTENLDRSIINKQSIVLHSHFSFVPRVTAEYKFDCHTKCHGDEILSLATKLFPLTQLLIVQSIYDKNSQTGNKLQQNF